jgi:hypothetical protein|tara:strand:+ start:123 stop:455 length:333 start_codon:yes stop_codon:yes gene_type:complete
MAILANLFIDQGTDFTIVVDVSDATGEILNLSGYVSAGQIRKTYGSSTIAATFTTTNANATGKVTMSLTDTQTSALEPGRYVYDMNITSSAGVTTRVVEGQAIITPGVTR